MTGLYPLLKPNGVAHHHEWARRMSSARCSIDHETCQQSQCVNEHHVESSRIAEVRPVYSPSISSPELVVCASIKYGQEGWFGDVTEHAR
ncbi:hypothetical protein CBOM_07595 [Ceraceosorus bombacis]|uniref:Uncharacterized protein n=1 Tax=Ceraceosorus bombacis TaxID=401625 RepID=A0A0P1BB29_9BASI|nr:hypothetical protein CBOM_07595 [Ceraceosorus bombacis]